MLENVFKLLGLTLLLKTGKGYKRAREKTPADAKKRYKVIVWGTGFVGKQVIRQLLTHTKYELVGVIVNNPEKNGQDVGTICGVAPIGMKASIDARAILSLEADAVAYYGPTAEFLVENMQNLTLCMDMGKDIVTTALTPLVYPKACPTGMVGTLDEVCQRTGRTVFNTGIDPGFANDLLPMALMSVCGHVERVRVQEILDYASYQGDYKAMGLGEPVTQKALLENPEVLIYAWGHTVPMMADALGVELEKIDTVWEKWADAKGNCAAVRFEVRGWYKGEPRIILEHCNRLGKEAAPEWPRGKMYTDDVYRVIIEGEPNIEQETALRDKATRDANRAGCLATGMRAIHAIPAVCAAPPGLLSTLDLPILAGFGNLS